MSDRHSGGGIIAWFAANPVAANLLMLLVIALGVVSLETTRREAFPSLEPDSITVSVTYDSGDARQAEEGIAIKIENQLEDVVGIKSISSSATGSGATVTITRQADHDLDVLLEDVTAAVDAISTFPADARNPIIEKARREQRALWLQLYGDTDRHTLQQLATDLKSDLLARDNISQVTVNGWLDPMISVEIDEGRLQSHGLTISDVENAINEGSASTSTAVLRNDTTYVQLMASAQAYEATEFAKIPLITDVDGRTILLGQVAKITDGFDDSSSMLSRFNGHDSIALQVISTGSDDITRTVDAALAVVQDWQDRALLPRAVELTAWADRSTSIEQRLDLLVSNAITGIGLVFILLALFLNLRVAFWVAAGLPFIFFGTLHFMGDAYLGLTLNEFTTFGFIMALGIVVDDAVVVGESIYTERRSQGDTLSSTIRGTLRVAVPTLFGVFTTVVAFAALSQTSGRLGSLYSQFAYIVGLCLVLSVVESKLILPAHLSHLDTRVKSGHRLPFSIWPAMQAGADSALQWFSNRIYRPVIDGAIRHRYAVLLLFVALFVWVIAMPFTGSVRLSFFPEISGDTVRASLLMQNDTSYGQTHRNLALMEDGAHDADRQLRGGTGSSAIANLQIYAGDDQSGQIVVELAEDSPYNIREFTRVWRQTVGLPEGARSINIRNSPVGISALRVELRANDDVLLKQAGEAMREALESYPGISGIEDNLEPGQPQLQLAVNAQGRALGFTTEMLAKQVLQAFSGQVVQRFQRNDDEIEVKVRYPAEDRQNLADVLDARVRTVDDVVIPLAAVASVTQGYDRDTINRIDGRRAVYISGEVDRDTLSATELVASLKDSVVPAIQSRYPGVTVYFAGEAEQQAETQASMLQMFLFAMLGIYMLLAIPLKSYIQPVLIMTAIPFGIVGAILGHRIYDLSLGILSLNGIIALSGVVVNDSLLLVSRFNSLRTESGSLTAAITEACRDRLRPVLLTSITTFAGLMPLLGETSFQAQFLIPAAVSLGYGILFATVITLVLIPVLLSIQHDVAGLFRSLHEQGRSVASGRAVG